MFQNFLLQSLFIKFLLEFISVCSSLPEHIVPDLMFFENHANEHHHVDANMHHFLDTNLYRARPRVRKFKYFIKIESKKIDLHGNFLECSLPISVNFCQQILHNVLVKIIAIRKKYLRRFRRQSRKFQSRRLKEKKMRT